MLGFKTKSEKSQLTIHGVPLSVHTRKAIVAAIWKRLDYKLEPVVPFNPPENWAQLSPTGLIPVIEHDGFTLPDSTAICLYLDRIAPEPPLLPRGDRDFARALFLDAYAQGTLFRNVVHGLFFQKIIRPGMLNEETDQAAIDDILANAQPKIFGYLESQLEDGHFVGGAFSLADLAVASNLINYRYLGFEIDRAAHPKLAAFLDRVIEAPAFRTALTAEAPFAEQMGLDRSFAREPA
jgi:glutathione S-transferase